MCKLNVLAVNKFFYHYGGVESHYFALVDLLKGKGHDVIHFAMLHRKNVASVWSSFFVTEVDYESARGLAKLRAALRTLYSLEARRKLRSLIKTKRPDIAHLHHIYHQISSSILYELHNFKIPIIQTLQDYKLVCPNYKMYIDHRSEICQRCIGGYYYNVIKYRCMKQGLAASILAAVEAYLNLILRPYHRFVDHFITPSIFLKEKLVKAGFSQDKISVLYNFINTGDFSPSHGGNSVLFLGRLVPEKGGEVLIKAAARMKHVDFWIAGTGSQEVQLRRQAAGLPNVRFLGRLSSRDVRSALSEALCVVVPSLWHDVAPVVIQEAFAAGKPVIGTLVGGIPELVSHYETGLLVPPGDVEALVEAINQLYSNPALAMRMGRAARERAEKLYSPDLYYRKLLSLYWKVISEKR